MCTAWRYQQLIHLYSTSYFLNFVHKKFLTSTWCITLHYFVLTLSHIMDNCSASRNVITKTNNTNWWRFASFSRRAGLATPGTNWSFPVYPWPQCWGRQPRTESRRPFANSSQHCSRTGALCRCTLTAAHPGHFWTSSNLCWRVLPSPSHEECKWNCYSFRPCFGISEKAIKPSQIRGTIIPVQKSQEIAI